MADNLDQQNVENQDQQNETQETQQETQEQEHWLGELADNPSFEKFKDKEPVDLAKSYSELEKLVGKEKIALPEDADSELWDDVWSRLGRPESSDKYDLGEAKEKLEQLSLDEEALNEVKEVAHGLGLNNKQLSGLVDKYADITTGQLESLKSRKEQIQEENVEGLKKEWGAAFEERAGQAHKAYKSLCGDNEALRKKIEDSGWGNDPDFVKMFYNISQQLSEDSLGGQTQQSFSKTPEDAKAEIKEIQSQGSDGPFWNESHPEHERMVEKVDKLYKFAYPELAA